MADESVLEIWSKTPSFLSGIREEHSELEGNAVLPQEIQNDLDYIHTNLTRDEDIACLSSLQIGDAIDDSMFSPSFKSAPFSWHLGLNKAINKINQKFVDKYQNRHEIALDAGILPCGVMGITLTREGDFLLGERNPETTHTIGNYCLVPAGFLSFGKPGSKNNKVILETFNREFFEEVLYTPDLFLGDPYKEHQKMINNLVSSYSAIWASLTNESSPKIAGITYEDRNNRGFGIPIIFKTSFSSKGLDGYLRMKKLDVEHKGYLLREFSPDSIENLVINKGKELEIHTLGALLCAGANEFDKGNEWYEKMVGEVIPKNYGKVLTLPEKTFKEKRDVIEVVKETAQQRYKI